MITRILLAKGWEQDTEDPDIWRKVMDDKPVKVRMSKLLKKSTSKVDSLP